MRFRIFIFKDPDAEARGYSLAGIKVPLTTYAPVPADPQILSYDDTPAYGRHKEYWSIPACLLIIARPELSWPLRKIDNLLVPTDWCSIDPVMSWDDLDRGIA